MKNLFCTMLILPLFSFSQIAEFETNFLVGNGVTTEVKMKWEIYENKIIGSYTDEIFIKMLRKQNQPTVNEYKLETFEKNKDAMFKKDLYENYVFENDMIRILITRGQLVKFSTKDTFTGKTSEISYVYVNK